eukprot:gb/GECH01004620.1/.p1 GENE.gb/GECH01004620.1/~~gb/GECH01004620.1/.p1  ORF type:complete len:763 (+),score=306.82 gb/GECH01004620.1/:1-2289(+)
MRTYMKGGAWKNTEDEILKAAVMKYGKNQWARIASLLNRKSPKQCKARWYEWLDPSIKKTEWTREEEEKLLHLAKLMPTQWRTIAPIVGRTPHQCLEHYEKLLDQASRAEGEETLSEDPRRAKVGEADPNPETRPARPDPVDMDEDEKEMLSEARARLANTKGKKAKRKAREKQLEEARRLASLQKRRELKAAGIYVPINKKRKPKSLDLAHEIPFERQAPAGFFDTSEEDQIAHMQRSQFKATTLQKLEGKRRDEIEEEERKKDIKRQRKQEKKDPSAVMQMNKLNNPQQVRKRIRMSIPEPQVSDRELEEVGKLSESSKQSAENSSNQITQHLLATPSSTPGVGGTPSGSGTPGTATPNAGRTPLRTPKGQDTIHMAAKNAKALRDASTPLMGGEVQLNEAYEDFGGLTPKSQAQNTPNPLATPTRETSTKQVAAKQEKRRQSLLKKQLQSGLRQLPTPSSDSFRIVIPSTHDQDEDAEHESKPMEEDAEESARRIEAARHAREEERKKQRSTAIQRELPRPVAPNTDMAIGNQLDKINDPHLLAEEMLKNEMVSMLQYDCIAYPYGDIVDNEVPDDLVRKMQPISKDEYDEAKTLIDKETKVPSSEKWLEEWKQAWDEEVDQFIYVPSMKRHIRLDSVSKNQNIEGLKHEWKGTRSHLDRTAKHAAKLEKKVGTLMGGYQKRSSSLKSEIQSLHEQIEQASIELESFKMLSQFEETAAKTRLAKLKEEVQELTSQGNNYQSRYLELKRQIDTLENQLTV